MQQPQNPRSDAYFVFFIIFDFRFIPLCRFRDTECIKNRVKITYTLNSATLKTLFDTYCILWHFWSWPLLPGATIFNLGANWYRNWIRNPRIFYNRYTIGIFITSARKPKSKCYQCKSLKHKYTRFCMCEMTKGEIQNSQGCKSKEVWNRVRM